MLIFIQNIFPNYPYTDVDECASSPCVHGNCTDQINGYVCECIHGYIGVVCETGIWFMPFSLFVYMMA